MDEQTTYMFLAIKISKLQLREIIMIFNTKVSDMVRYEFRFLRVVDISRETESNMSDRS